MAGVPVLHDGDPAAALAALVDQTGLPADQFSPQDLAAVRKLAPRVVGAATLRHCAGAGSRNAALRAHQVRAEAALRAGDAAVAQDHLDLGIAGLGCLTEPVEARVAARLFVLRGAMLASQGETERARGELQTALALDPAVQWLGGVAEAHAGRLDAVRAVAPAAELTISPPPRGAAPWVDGRPVQTGVVLRPGLHLVQVPATSGLRSAWLTIDGDAALVVLEAQRAPALEGIAARPPDRHALWLVQAAADSDSAYVVHAGGIWLVELTDARPRVTELRPRAEAAAPAEDAGTARGRKGRRR